MLQNAISYSATYDSSNINFLFRHAQQNNASSNAGTSTRHHRPLSGNQPLLLIQSDFWNVFYTQHSSGIAMLSQQLFQVGINNILRN